MAAAHGALTAVHAPSFLGRRREQPKTNSRESHVKVTGAIGRCVPRRLQGSIARGMPAMLNSDSHQSSGCHSFCLLTAASPAVPDAVTEESRRFF
ncbi:hypothetical protein MRX96_007060 [Rhipicephalus microplus]